MQRKKIGLLFLIIIPVWFSHAKKYPNVYVNSIPKCGTHLVTRCVELMAGMRKHNTMGDMVTKNNLPVLEADEFPYFHVRYSLKAAEILEKGNYRCLFVYRDPRDQVVSYAYWRFVRYKWKDNKSFPAVINELIDEVAATYKAFLPWVRHPLYYTLKFEDLIGPQGGGNQEAQNREIRNIARHLKIKMTDTLLESICSNLFGQGGTFREGQIGSWREHFTESQKRRFKDKAGDLLIQLGYETSLDW